MKRLLFLVLVLLGAGCRQRGDVSSLVSDVSVPIAPILALKEVNEVASLRMESVDDKTVTIRSVSVSLSAAEGLGDLERVFVLKDHQIVVEKKIRSHSRNKTLTLRCDLPVKGEAALAVGIRTRDEVNLDNKIRIGGIQLMTDQGLANVDCSGTPDLRMGIALRQKGQDGVNNCRIPGLVRTPKGTLIAVYDARRDRDRDLQGNIDICYNRSTDGGKTWSEMQVAMDMGAWGGLPEKYNGVSDPCILVDGQTGEIFVSACWMHGVIDEKTGKWTEGLTESSEVWNHQWRKNGTLPGYGVRESSQWLVVRSRDDGMTWSEPENYTRSVKPESYCLTVNAPGAGITLSDGTLVFPGQGRDEEGRAFSTILYSKDHGDTWESGASAVDKEALHANESMCVQLADGSLMLNMRSSKNRGNLEENGRLVSITRDLGKTWEEHPTSGHVLTEPTCQASLIRHLYRDASGKEIPVLLFFNPNDPARRVHHTLRCSLDEGMTWPENLTLEVDEGKGNGYSCLVSIDERTVGVLYEGSGACLVYQQIRLDDIL